LTTTDVATVNQALLALYGALDRAVTSNSGPDVESIVERYLPGSTGPNAGWYDELLGFLGQQPPRGVHAMTPSLELSSALTLLQDRRTYPGEDADAESLSPVQLSRMAYAIGALSQLPMYQDADLWGEQFTQTLAVVSPDLAPNSDLLALLNESFRRRDDWPTVMRSAYSQNLVDGAIAAVPLCDLKAKWVQGHLSAVLTTEFDSTEASLTQLENVIDPLNWAKCLSFFCAMEAKATRADGWSRVLEHVSTTCAIAGTPQMVTPLKYWKGPQDNESTLTAYLNYALDEAPADDGKGDGRVVVDEGFIRMTSTSGDPNTPGVHVRTRKVVAFRDVSWIAGAIFACSMGYGYEGMDMLLGGVKKRAKDTHGWTDWMPSIPTPQGGPVDQPGQPGQTPDPSRRAVKIAVDMANECIDDMSTKSAAIAAKWAAGQVPIEETIAYGADLAVRLAVDPWRDLERLRDSTQGNNT
jgi:hypothetical protein